MFFKMLEGTFSQLLQKYVQFSLLGPWSTSASPVRMSCTHQVISRYCVFRQLDCTPGIQGSASGFAVWVEGSKTEVHNVVA